MLSTIDDKRVQASNVCISIFTDLDIEDLDHAPHCIVRAYQLGEEILEQIEFDKNIKGSMEGCGMP